MTLLMYVNIRIKKISSLGEKIMRDILLDNMGVYNMYYIKPNPHGVKYVKRITDESYFDEYYNRYKYLNEDKSYFVWYKEHWRPNESKRAKRGRKMNGKRQRIFQRDGFRCVACKTSENLTIDHIQPYSKSGNDTIYNWITLCQKCNKKKGNMLLVDSFIDKVVIPHIKQVKENLVA